MKVGYCEDCGRQGLPFVGMFSACPCSGDGGHRDLKQIEIDEGQAIADLKAILPGLPGFDQVRVRRWLNSQGL